MSAEFSPGTEVEIVNPAGETVDEGRVLDYINSRFGRLIRLVEGEARMAWPAQWARDAWASDGEDEPASDEVDPSDGGSGRAELAERLNEGPRDFDEGTRPDFGVDPQTGEPR